MRSLWAQIPCLILILKLASLPIVTASIFSDPVLSYCKCICFSNSTIIPLWHPSDPSKPCLSCTKQFCIDQKLPICRDAEVPELDTDVGTGLEGDVEARCFKRDSPRDQLIVTFFLLTVIGLLLYASIRARLQKAIENRGRPTDLREWSEALLPEPLHPFSASLLSRVPGRGRGGARTGGVLGRGDMQEARGSRGYAPVSVGS
ncbi:hypothetical protein TREMEDRAFT_36910 [Tremella mesenterica DSM 1558]|uniref:uncharacterized protein n=1 Tax=Tremella mesenterica (strain ATCC 24925 / CBS 8224 / DSM 1558 / NBRC 9311 / NRRL Y-6157 / RJB 2259-6 / UBC 559-6) TaxID=578456 RepID=UPI0003F49A46|nr:uncharacterized protein TREMEDRAFT_36910 [Tremella mesenterica DSM 1558]EIW72739.1 hypothetical protein TREMEDRAFT_36910 [Tremella mesenterica DSM 1558]